MLLAPLAPQLRLRQPRLICGFPAGYYPAFSVREANILIIDQWSVTLCFVANFLEYGKMLSQDSRVFPLDLTVAITIYLCLMQDLVYIGLIPI